MQLKYQQNKINEKSIRRSFAVKITFPRDCKKRKFLQAFLTSQHEWSFYIYLLFLEKKNRPIILYPFKEFEFPGTPIQNAKHRNWVQLFTYQDEFISFILFRLVIGPLLLSVLVNETTNVYRLKLIILNPYLFLSLFIYWRR